MIRSIVLRFASDPYFSIFLFLLFILAVNFCYLSILSLLTLCLSRLRSYSNCLTKPMHLTKCGLFSHVSIGTSSYELGNHSTRYWVYYSFVFLLPSIFFGWPIVYGSFGGVYIILNLFVKLFLNLSF